MKNYYEILNLPLDASEDEIKKQYRILAKKYHPDTSKNTNSAHMFYLITKAYKVLSNKEERVKYNEQLLKVKFSSKKTNITKPTRPVKQIKVIYSRSLGVLAKRGFFLTSIPKKYRKKNDIKYDIEVVVDYFEAQKGGIVKIDVPVKILCWECNGQDHYCHICDGKGYLVRASRIKVVIPSHPKSGEIFEVDLRKIKQGNLAVIRAQKLRMKIVLTHQKTNYKQLQGFSL